MFVSKLDTKDTTTIFLKYSKHSAGQSLSERFYKPYSLSLKSRLKTYLLKTAFILISLE